MPPAPCHPEDRDKLCHSIPKALSTPGSHFAPGYGAQLFPLEPVSVGTSLASGVTSEAKEDTEPGRGHRDAARAT